MTTQELLAKVSAQLADAGVPGHSQAARWLLCHSLQCTPAHLAATGAEPVDLESRKAVLATAERCALHEPLQYVIGHTQFLTLRLAVDPRVLIPRPETELLAEIAIEHAGRLSQPQVLDIGTGSGCIALAIKHAHSAAAVVACDISADALVVAQANAATNELSVRLVEADVCADSFRAKVGTGFDVVVSNPPYIPEWERGGLSPWIHDHEPSIALFCGDDPLAFYRAILGQRVGRRDARIVLETHADYARHVGALAETMGYREIEVIDDLAGYARFVVAQAPDTG